MFFFNKGDYIYHSTLKIYSDSQSSTREGMGAVRICRASVMKQCTQGLGKTVHTRFG